MVKYRRLPTAARREPITKVTEMTVLTLMPMSRAVSKSLDTARMAMPILVCLMKRDSATTSTMVSTGVTSVTRLVTAPKTLTVSLSQGSCG